MISEFKEIFMRKQKEIFLADSDEHKDFLVKSLEEEEILGLDTEFDWKNTYFPKLSLLQIATKDKILLIDCLKFKNLKWLKSILEDKEKLIIFHSSRSDTTVLSTNLNIKIKNIFDVQIAEKKINGGYILNYGEIVKKYFSKNLNKSETNSNWLKRPFTNEQLSYAADDVNFLISLYKKQLKILKKADLEEIIFKESRIESSYGNQELYISRLKKLKKASKIEKDIFIWREKYAGKINIPPSKIFVDRNLKKIAEIIKKDKFPVEELKKSFQDRKFIKVFLTEFNL